MTLESYLNIKLGWRSRASESTGTSTTRNAECSVDPANVVTWGDILTDLPPFDDNEDAVRNDSTNGLRVILPIGKESTSEAAINSSVTDCAKFVSQACGTFDATDTAQRVRGRPDVHIYRKLGNSKETRIVGEVKTFWAFPIDNESLFELWTSGSTVILPHDTSLHQHLIDTNSHIGQSSEDTKKCWCYNRYTLEKKAFEAVRQIHGYMVSNKVMYGFLTNWDQWWFLKTIDGSTLSVSQSFRFNNENPTVCQLLGRLLLATCTGFKFEALKKPELNKEIKSSTDNAVKIKSLSMGNSANNRRSARLEKRQSQNIETHSKENDHADVLAAVFSQFLSELSLDPDVLQYFLLSLNQMYIGYGRTGSVFKAVVHLKQVGTFDVALKIADVMKCPELDEELEFEAHAYKKLASLQGKCIPHLYVDKPIWYYRGITKCLVTSYEGESLNNVDISTIPLNIRQQARKDYSLIHKMGVSLTDMKKSNVCWNVKRQQIVFIDFGAVYLLDEKRGLSCGDVYSDDAEDIDSILDLDLKHE